MLKDTKSLGNNKAPACESRGFVLKKEGVLFDTPSKSPEPDTPAGTPEEDIYKDVDVEAAGK